MKCMAFVFAACLCSTHAFASLESSIGLSPSQATFRTIALTGDTAPGFDAAAVFSGFFETRSVINAAGEVSFIAEASDPLGSDEGVWTTAGGSLRLVARSSDVSPTLPGGVAGATFQRFERVWINDVGQTTFSAPSGYWTDRASGLQADLRSGDPAPGQTVGVTFRDPALRSRNPPSTSDIGAVFFTARLTGFGIQPTEDRGVWMSSDVGVSALVQEGDPAPGLGPGAFFSDISNRLVSNASGEVIFTSGIRGVVDLDDDGTTIWKIETDGSLQLLAKRGDAAPGSNLGLTFQRFGRPSINDAGHYAFSANLAGPGVASFVNDFGVWKNMGLGNELVARLGDRAPGTEDGVTFEEFNVHFMNGRGDVAFVAELERFDTNIANDVALFSETLGGLSLISREDDPLPELGQGVRWGGAGDPRLNAVGDVLFGAGFEGPGINFDNDGGLLILDENGVLSILLREGDIIDVDNDPLREDLRQVEDIRLALPGSGQEGSFTSINDAREVVLELRFKDGSEGIVIATVPEPTSLALLGVGGIMLARRRRGQKRGRKGDKYI